MGSTRTAQLRRLITEFGGQTALSAKVGVSPAQLGQYLGGYRNLGEKVARKIEHGAGKPVGWLDTPGGDAAASAAVTRCVPLISWAFAKNWCDTSDPGTAEDWLACPVKHGPRTYALRVKGDAMSSPGNKPSFDDGDLIFVDPDRQAMHRSPVVVCLPGAHEAAFRRLLVDGGIQMLEAINLAWPNRISQMGSDAEICGVVIARVEVV